MIISNFSIPKTSDFFISLDLQNLDFEGLIKTKLKMKKHSFSLVIILFFSSFGAFAQIKLKLANGQNFVLEGAKETYKDKYNSSFYVKETNDTIYSYKYQSGFLEETRVPLAFLGKANIKNAGANVKFYDAKKFANGFHFVGFTCAKNGKNMEEGFNNSFIFIKYGTTSDNQAQKPQISTICQANIYFPLEQVKEAKAFLKTIEERIKSIK